MEMNGYAFIASIFASVVSLAWPAAFVAIVWLFRQKLIDLLPHLHVEYGGLSLRLQQAEEAAAALPAQAPDPEVQPTPEEVDRFEQLAAISPRAAILEERRSLEEALMRRVQALGESTGKSVLPVFAATRLLRSKGIINEQISGILDDLRNIGNTAAHSLGQEVTKEDADRFKTLSEKVKLWLFHF